MVARSAQVVGGVLPAAPSGIPCAARRRRGSLSGSATPRHPRRDARRGMFPLHDPPAFPGLPGLLHAQRRHALRLRPRSAGLSGGGRSPREQRVLKCVAVTPAGRRSMVVTTRLGNPGSNPANRRSRILPKKYIILPRALFSDAKFRALLRNFYLSNANRYP